MRTGCTQSPPVCVPSESRETRAAVDARVDTLLHVRQSNCEMHLRPLPATAMQVGRDLAPSHGALSQHGGSKTARERLERQLRMQESLACHPLEFLVPELNVRFPQAAPHKRRSTIRQQEVNQPDHNADMKGGHLRDVYCYERRLAQSRTQGR